LLVLALPVAAEAQDDLRPHAVVLLLGGDAAPERAREARAIASAALEADGVRLVPEANLTLRIAPARLTSCAAVDCALEIARELGVAMAVTVTLWQGPPENVTVSLLLDAARTYTASREIGAAGLDDAVRAAVREAQAQRGRGLEPAVATPERTAPQTNALLGRSLEEWVLPITLGVVGLGLVALSVYSLIDEICAQRGASGACLRGDRANYGLGVTIAIVGGLSVVGSIAWLIIGGTPTLSAGSGIQVVLGPTGVQGSF
jgi:hypothetical protein